MIIIIIIILIFIIVIKMITMIAIKIIFVIKTTITVAMKITIVIKLMTFKQTSYSLKLPHQEQRYLHSLSSIYRPKGAIVFRVFLQ